MSRKRQQKKERSRLEALDRQLEDLYLQGADEAFLELAAGRGRDTPSSAAAYAEVLDRALRRALAAGDLPQLERLLRSARRDAATHPLVLLAEAVAHLGAGRLDEARAALAALPKAGEAGGAAVAPRLVADLTALCSPGALPKTGGVEVPGLREVWRFSEALDALGNRGSRPPAKAIERLRGAAGALRAALPADPAATRLLDAAEEHARLLAELADAERSLSRRKRGDGFRRAFLEQVRRLSRSLSAAFRTPTPLAGGLLRPLHHALHRRWRALLELAADRGDTAVWAEAIASSPALFAADLSLGAGFEEGAERLAGWATVHGLLAAGDFQGLALRLASRSKAEDAPERVAVLWSLELWAWERAVATADEADEPGGSAPPERPAHAALVRLQQMAAEVPQRIPVEQRPEVARFLRGRLFHLFDTVFFCSHSLDAAAALLRHLPDDPALLAAALAGAVCARDERARSLFAARIAARGPATSAAERDAVLVLVSAITMEEPERVVRILPPLRTLVGDAAWAGVLSTVLRKYLEVITFTLRWIGGEVDLGSIQRDLEVYRPLLAGRAELAVLEVALECLGRDSGAPRRLRKLLERSTDLEPALVAFEVLAAVGPFVPRRLEKALDETRDAVIDRLDLRWRLWLPQLSDLLLGADASQIGRLRERLLLLERRDGLAEHEQRALEQALEMVEAWRGMRLWGRPNSREAGRTAPSAGRRRGKPRRRPADDPQIGFDLF